MELSQVPPTQDSEIPTPPTPPEPPNTTRSGKRVPRGPIRKKDKEKSDNDPSTSDSTPKPLFHPYAQNVSS